jgi:hypothetical protein
MNVSLLAFSCAFDFDLHCSLQGALTLTIDDLHKTDMWNWCSLGRLFLLLKLLLFRYYQVYSTATAAFPDCFSDTGEVFQMKY